MAVGPCALDYSKMKTQDHFWTDPPADELVQRHRLSSGLAPPGNGPSTPPSSRRPLGLQVPLESLNKLRASTHLSPIIMRVSPFWCQIGRNRRLLFLFANATSLHLNMVSGSSVGSVLLCRELFITFLEDGDPFPAVSDKT